MTYLFFGTPEFAAIILEKLISAGFLPRAVVCNPDKPVGRKKIITPPPVKQLIAERKEQIVILQPEKLDSSLKFQVSSLNPDFFVVAAYSKILPKEILNIPKLGSIGVHPSLLPKYRGPTPIQTAILNGETETGVTLYLMDEKVDHGPILAKRELEFPISNFQFPILLKKLAELGGDLLIETLPKFLRGEIKPLAQNETQATYTKKFTAEDGFVDLEKDEPALIERKIRAFNPEPGVWTIKNGKRMKILEAQIIDKRLVLKKIQVEGKKPVVTN